MTSSERFYIILTLMSVLIIPGIALMVKITARWTRIETDLRKLVIDKDRTHAAMLEQMKEDRAATNRRLEWLERQWMERGMRNGR